MIGGNRQYSIYRQVRSRNAQNEVVKCYPDAYPVYSDVWCRNIRRESNVRPEVKVSKATRSYIEERLLVVPIVVTVKVDDIAKRQDTGQCFLIKAVEDISDNGQTYQCPIVRVPGLTKETS